MPAFPPAGAVTYQVPAASLSTHTAVLLALDRLSSLDTRVALLDIRLTSLLEHFMADTSVALADLTAGVDALVAADAALPALKAALVAQQQANASLQTAVDGLTIDDQAQKDLVTQAQADATAASTATQAAFDEVEVQVGRVATVTTDLAAQITPPPAPTPAGSPVVEPPAGPSQVLS